MTVILVEDSMRQDAPPSRESGKFSTQEQHIVDRLAQETESSEQEARDTYERERARLDGNARVKTYVSIIAARRAKDALRRKGS